MKRPFSLFVALSFLLNGCSLFVPKTQTFDASCSQSDAILKVNGQAYVGSVKTDIPRNKSVFVQCTKDGYHDSQKLIGYSLSGAGVADLIGVLVFLVPGVGLFTPGAFSLDETAVDLSMIRNTSSDE